MPTGKVKWFNNAKGYGFILPDTGSDDLFAHYSSIQMSGYKTLKAGQAVTYEVIPGDKGLHAVNIAIEGELEQPAHTSFEQSHSPSVKTEEIELAHEA